MVDPAGDHALDRRAQNPMGRRAGHVVQRTRIEEHPNRPKLAESEKSVTRDPLCCPTP